MYFAKAGKIAEVYALVAYTTVGVDILPRAVLTSQNPGVSGDAVTEVTGVQV
jgi:hypothetical protein